MYTDGIKRRCRFPTRFLRTSAVAKPRAVFKGKTTERFDKPLHQPCISIYHRHHFSCSFTPWAKHWLLGPLYLLTVSHHCLGEFIPWQKNKNNLKQILGENHRTGRRHHGSRCGNIELVKALPWEQERKRSTPPPTNSGSGLKKVHTSLSFIQGTTVHTVSHTAGIYVGTLCLTTLLRLAILSRWCFLLLYF